ncbi:response regulator [Colwellia sp. D2M02]|uniref:ATP-binding protein n=1 Tax=Colwellia sp. D2M02 TaxID=2841562 RepID=UPI001C09097F|nr:response regulator [Colwellia sp. D2M02]
MYYQLSKNTVFRRYNTAVVVAFLVIIIIALSISTVRYFNQLAHHKSESIAELKDEATQLNNMLEQSEQAVEGIQELAQYYIKIPSDISGNLPALSQDGEVYFLDKQQYDVVKEGQRLSGNITGIGNIEKFSAEQKQEITMAYALTPAFVAAKKTIKEATWFYYVSFSQFVSMYPWVDRDIWQFNSTTLTNPHHKEMKKYTEETNRAVWSAPYLDSAGTGMNTSIGKGVFYQDKLIGAVVIDISLTRLHAKLSELESDDAGMVLYNQDDHILLFKRNGKKSLAFRATWDDLLPVDLAGLNATKLSTMDDASQVGNWFIEKQSLELTGWTLLKYQSYDNFIAPLRSDFAFVFIILFVALLVFLMLVNTMTKRTFIKPTTEFIRHIEYCSEGDPGKVKPNADWLHWFQVVEDIFTQNRSLLLQLKEQNDVLDSRVIEKTRALQETSMKHQRDYASLRSVMNAIPELIIFNDPQGFLMGCNRAFEQIAACSEQSMLGAKAVNFMPKALAKEINYLNSVYTNTYPQQALIEAGDYVYQGFCNQFKNNQGEVLGTISIFRDVTVQQATKSALEKAKDQAEYANQVKIQFLANMSHEVRTPINAMQGMMDLLHNTALDSRQQHYLVNAQRASTTLLHLIDELLDLSKIEAGKMVVNNDCVNLPEIIDKALKLNITNVNAEKVNIQVELDENVPSYVMSDEMRLVQVLANLFNNAIKFTEQGTISLFIEALSTNDEYSLVRFTMADTGIGIAKEKQGHLFEAFSQADDSMTRKYGGSGLGLSICQHIVQRLGGTITLKSELGKGSELSFKLPLVHVDAAAHEKECFLSLFADEPLVNSVAVCAIKQETSSSFQASISKMQGHFYYFESISELCEANINDPIILLVDEDVFNQQMLTNNNQKLFIHCEKTLQLLCLCQSAMTPLSNETCLRLEELTAPYLLLDKPLFRYSLTQIFASLQSNKAKVSEVSKQTDSTPDLKNNAIVDDIQSVSIAALALEATAEKTASKERQATSQVKHNLAGVEVLLVEDNLVNQLVAKELLLAMNASVTIADNGQCALDLLAEQAFDVVLMDIQMPVMDGLTAAKKIREQRCFTQLPIIAMTAHAREEDKQHSLAVGMNRHIAKPVTAKMLYDTIEDVLPQL